MSTSTAFDENHVDEKAVGTYSTEVDSDSPSIDTLAALINKDGSHDSQVRTTSWQKAARLLVGDQLCLAMMGQAWSLSVLGWVPGKTTMAVVGILFWITSITMHKFIMKNPQIKDICGFAYCVFGKSRIAYKVTVFMLLANNIMRIGFHVLTGAKMLNTFSDHSQCMVLFSIIVMLIGIVMSLPRTLKQVSFVSMFSEKAPLYGYDGNYPTNGQVKTNAFPLPGTSRVACMNAVLNITFLWVPQILFPTFISEMERRQDFPKSLAVLIAVSAVLVIVPPAIGFHYLGQYAAAPAFGSLGVTAYKKASFAVVIVPTIVIGAIYANCSAKFVYRRIMGRTRHAHSNTVMGWGAWGAIIAVLWLSGFIFAEVVPSMGDFLSLLSAAFGSFFGLHSSPLRTGNCIGESYSKGWEGV